MGTNSSFGLTIFYGLIRDYLDRRSCQFFEEKLILSKPRNPTRRRISGDAKDLHIFPVLLAEGPHPFPFRIRKLSPPALMVLAGQLAGRVGQRRGKFKARSSENCCAL